MILTLVIILLLIGAAVVGSIYSNFIVFYSNFNESENYHRAYYNSISALERAELVIKQRDPGYVGSGGWINGTGQGLNTDGPNNGLSDGIINSNFSYLSDEFSRNKSSIFRSINSRTNRIPIEGKGDVDTMLATGDSLNFNMMDYEDAQVFLLYYDESGGNPYTSGSIVPSKTATISGTIRLPLKLTKSFGQLNKSEALVSGGPKNDAIVDRQIRGRYDDGSTTYPFTIYSTQNIFNEQVTDNLDSAIREGDINKEEDNTKLDFVFSDNKWSPTTRGGESELTIISPKETEIKANTKDKFKTVLNNDSYTRKQLRFSLLNLLKTTNNMVYPFLEYYVDFGTDVSDKYFNINAEGNYDDYKINKIIRKPTNKESVLGNFTTIF